MLHNRAPNKIRKEANKQDEQEEGGKKKWKGDFFSKVSNAFIEMQWTSLPSQAVLFVGDFTAYAEVRSVHLSY